ncbi:FtsK/SpoIIIE domain-containing protein [Brevibacillus laterosporus]|uniref:FtsK/SpoIIIE domain-containing protein n=1 Tax=Brevibacillus laterosporus TaxID=1465 RepID=UPI003D1C18CD
MKLEQQFDQSIDKGIENAEKGLERFGTNVLVPFGNRISLGVRDVWQQKTWKTKEFALMLGVTGVLAGMGAAADLMYFSQIPDSTFWTWLYHKQKLTPYPVASTLPVISMLAYLNRKGRKVANMQYRFQLAFERVRLSSSRTIKIDDQNRQEFPQLVQYLRDADGGSLFIFQNVGVPLDRWEKAKTSFEATLGEEISDIGDWKNSSANMVMVKLGGAKIPRKISFTEQYVSAANSLSEVVLGISKDGPIVHDFSKNPHLIIAGATGAGKTVASTAVVYQAVKRLNGILFLIDFKGGVDYGSFEDMGIPIIDQRVKVMRLLMKLRKENDARIALFKQERGIRNIDDYNKKNKGNPLRRIFVLIDEMAVLTDAKSCPPEESDVQAMIIGLLSDAARLFRAAGIHMILTTQRPDREVMPGQIKDNVTGRLCGYFVEDIPYRIVLGFAPEPPIPNPKVWPGRFVYGTGSDYIHLQTPYFQDKHVDKQLQVNYDTGHLVLSGIVDGITHGAVEIPSLNLEKMEDMFYAES